MAATRRLISALVIRFLESIISKLTSSEISIFLLVSVAEKTGLCFALSETLKTGFLASRSSVNMHLPEPIVKSELPRPIPRNSVESDHGTSRIYFDNASDNVTLTLYIVTLTSQKPC